MNIVKAKDMFEQRGYEQYWNDVDIVAYKRKNFISDTEKIIIYKKTKTFEGLIESDSPFTPNEPLTITYEELQAINQQMKEIGDGE